MFVKIILPALAVYAPEVLIILATLAVIASFLWIFGPLRRWTSGAFWRPLLMEWRRWREYRRESTRPARTWIVDQAADLPGLEQRLNYLDEHSFVPVQVLAGLEPPFLIVAVRAWR